MIFVIDVDDTLSDTDEYSEEFISNFFVAHNLPYKLINKNSRYADGKFDWDTDTAIKWYKTYGDDMSLDFPVKPNAVETVNELYDAGHKIIFATARDKTWHNDPEGMTRKWLLKNGFKFHKLYVGREDKEQICLKENADYFIDDDIKICSRVLGYSKHTTPILTLTNFNRELEKPENLKMVANIAEIKDIIK